MRSNREKGVPVDFSLSEEQILLRESVQKYVADHGGVERHRRLSKSELGFDPQAWRAFAELGWLALPFAEEQDGLGGSVTDLMVLCESLGHGLVREPYLHTVVTCGGLLAALGDADQLAQYLPPLMAYLVVTPPVASAKRVPGLVRAPMHPCRQGRHRLMVYRDRLRGNRRA